MAAKQQKVRIEIPEGFSPAERQEIGEAIIQFIKDRCDAGFGVRPHGRGFRTYAFPEYTEEYAKKKGSRRVDLVLNDEMLNAMEILSTSRDSITIGYEAGTEENAKAEGNQIGSYGRAPNPAKARRFLGLTREEKEAILAGFKE